MWTAPHVPLLLYAGFESPAGPTPSPSAPPAPPWQGRSVASSKLWMLEFSAFLEQQQDPDTVGPGLGLARSLTCSCFWRLLLLCLLQLFSHLLLASCPGLLPPSTFGFHLDLLLFPVFPSSGPPSPFLFFFNPSLFFPHAASPPPFLPWHSDASTLKPSPGFFVHPSSLGLSLCCSLPDLNSSHPVPTTPSLIHPFPCGSEEPPGSDPHPCDAS